MLTRPTTRASSCLRCLPRNGSFARFQEDSGVLLPRSSPAGQCLRSRAVTLDLKEFINSREPVFFFSVTRHATLVARSKSRTTAIFDDNAVAI